MKNNPKHIPKIMLLMAMDSAFMILSWIGAMFLYSYLFQLKGTMILVLLKYFYILIPICILVFWICGVYRNIWLYASVPDLIRIATAAAVTNFIVYCIYKIIGKIWQNPAMAVMAFFLLLTMSAGIRFFPRIKKEVTLYFNQEKKIGKRVLIVGAGHSASMLIRELKRKEFQIIGFVDDDASKWGMRLGGIKVLGSCKEISEIATRLGIEEILIAIPSASKEQLNTIISYCPVNKFKIKLINSINDTAQGLQGLVDLNLADLLGREETKLNIDKISEMVSNEVVLVTGGGGSIGSELVRQLMRFDVKKIIIFDVYENNAFNLMQELCLEYKKRSSVFCVRIGSVQDVKRLEEVVAEFCPSIVFHAAAYKHVPLMEDAPEQAIKNNVFGTMNMARISQKYKAKKFVMISTDKAVNPTNIMGASKRLAERVVLSMNESGLTEFVCVRFGNVLGSNGSVVPIFTRQIESGGPITVTDPEIIRYFMTIPEASRLVIQAACMANNGELFVLDMGEPVKIVDLAKSMIFIAGLIPDVDIKIEFTGLRPGEKLYEELLVDISQAKKTDNDKIYVAKPPLDTEKSIENMIQSLQNALDDGSIIKCVKEIEPSFVPESEEKINGEKKNRGVSRKSESKKSTDQ